MAGARTTFDAGGEQEHLYRLEWLEKNGVASNLARLPYAIRVLLESALRNVDGHAVTEEDVRRLANWDPAQAVPHEIPFKPARVILQDFTGVPTLVDLAAMREAVQRVGGDPKSINPLVPVDLVIDHSVQVDYFGTAEALMRNAEIEFARNRERYEFLRWGQQALRNFRVVPPATGIVHQVNLEYLAKVVLTRREGDVVVALPDTVIGTDSHTTMINGLGVLGWGAGGIEAEAVMLGQATYMLAPQVVGVRLYGMLREGVTATDLTLTITQMLRKFGVVDKFVEYFGPGLSAMTLPDRATIGNMAPEYGATCGFFPVDAETLRYLRRTGRAEAEVQRVERYCKEQGLFRTDEMPDPVYSTVLELDLDTVEPSLAGPKRPQDRVRLSEVKQSFRKALTAPTQERGFGLPAAEVERTVEAHEDGQHATLRHGAVVIAAITSCTNTSNPQVMLAAGLLAKKAVEAGLHVQPYVKTSLAPGSKVVTDYLKAAGVMSYLEQLGFDVVGYGCTTCIGNSGPVPDWVGRAVGEGNLVAAAVLSGNRNFEGRVNPVVRANYLASPPLVVAYALAGTTDIDLTTEPLGTGKDGRPVYLRDIWPTQAEIAAAREHSIQAQMFLSSYANVFTGNTQWNAITGLEGDLFPWDPQSTYVQEPPYFETFGPEPASLQDIRGARVLAIFGDSVTTDHISPAGDIAENSPAGAYLKAQGVEKKDFNSYGSRRGNDRVMVRGTFANIRVKNLMLPGTEGGITRHLPDGQVGSIYDVAMAYKAEGVPLVVLAGKEYGTGSSRDWAAKGPLLLGVRAVIADSFERIHRSNLVGMGVLPLQFMPGDTVASLGLTGEEIFEISGLTDGLAPRKPLAVTARRPDGTTIAFQVVARLDTPVDVEYYRNGGILQTVLRNLLK